MFDSSPYIPFKRALMWIAVSIILTLTVSLMGWFYFLHLKELRLQDPRYRLAAMIQATPKKECLKTVCLAEWLNLSIDKPVNLYAFDSKKAEQKLLTSPLIKQVSLKKIRPGILYIEYEIRLPIAYLGDYVNAAIDEEGVVFPFNPFFTPKKLPVFYIGLSNTEKGWGECLNQDKRFQLACQVYQNLKERKIQAKQIDVSKAFADSFGQRQIIVTVEEEMNYQVKSKECKAIKPYVLRLHSEKYVQNLANYQVLKAYLMAPLQKELPRLCKESDKHKLIGSIIDFRIPHLAFIKQENKL